MARWHEASLAALLLYFAIQEALALGACPQGPQVFDLLLQCTQPDTHMNGSLQQRTVCMSRETQDTIFTDQAHPSVCVCFHAHLNRPCVSTEDALYQLVPDQACPVQTPEEANLFNVQCNETDVVVYTVLPNFQLTDVAIPNKSLTVYGYKVMLLCSRTTVCARVHFLPWALCVTHAPCLCLQ